MKLLLKTIWNFLKMNFIILIVVPIYYLVSTEIIFDIISDISKILFFTIGIISFILMLIGIILIEFKKKYIVFSKNKHLQNIISILFIIFSLWWSVTVYTFTFDYALLNVFGRW